MEADVAAEAFRRGASGYVLKQSAGTELLLAVRRVNEGQSYLSPLVARETLVFLFSKKQPSTKEQLHIDKARFCSFSSEACR
jgi:DNA-binding NarL/FixJ family response regulator